MNVPVFDWLAPNGQSIGCGTALEFSQWRERGIIPDGSTLGKTVTYENPVFDDNRRKQWEQET